MDSLDLLFLHVPKFRNDYRPYGQYMTINLIPMGTIALADRVHQAGYRTEILHLGLEWIERREFSPFHYMKEKEVKIAVLPLHFHPQSYDVMKVASEIKEARRETFVLLGGYTASLFSSGDPGPIPTDRCSHPWRCRNPSPCIVEGVGREARFGRDS